MRWRNLIACWFWLAPALFVTGAETRPHLVSVGQEHWNEPWVPDLGSPGRHVPIPVAKRIDVVVLGDGYLAAEQADFAKDLRAWYDRFLALTPYRELKGAFRVRGCWTPSTARATMEQKSFYHVGVATGKVAIATSTAVAGAVFGVLDTLEINRAQTSNRLSHTFVVLLIKDERGRNPSGLARPLTAPDKKRVVAVGFGADAIHEFGHSYGGLRDEYINRAEAIAKPREAQPVSLFTVSNLGYTREAAKMPWAHLRPGGAVNPDRDSLIGLLWLGGIEEAGVWHSEARCLMNGTHENWDLQKSRRGVGLRDTRRFCFWCEEIVMARTWWRTGQLGDTADGEEAWRRWEKARPLYHQAFQVPERIRQQNLANTKGNLAAAKIYERPE